MSLTGELSKIRQSALRMLARREHSYFELKQKLLRREYTENNINAILQKLTAQNLLSETRFAENYIRSRISKGYGPEKIKMELHEKGISKELIMIFFAGNTENWLVNIEKTWNKKFKNKKPENAMEWSKQIRYLQYRGFTLEQIITFQKHYDLHENI